MAQNQILTKKLLFLASICSVILFFIYQPVIKKQFQKDKIYILFDSKKHKDTIIDWVKYTDLFPKIFYPYNTLSDLSELAKLSEKQKFLFDSIRNTFYKYPRKIIKTKNGVKHYSLSVTNDFVINFKLLNIISLESVIKLISDSEYSKTKNIQ